MNPKTLLHSLLKPSCSPIFHSYIILFSLLTTFTLSYVDPKFEACEPKGCGNGQNISFPFYIQGKQEPFCGQPGFELTCDKNGFPVLNLVSTQYTIQEIFYNNRSLRVSILAFSESSTSACIAPTHNLTVDGYRFRLAPNQRDLLLFYGCDSTSLPKGMMQGHTIGFGCPPESRTSSVVALYKEDRNLRLAWESCKGKVVNATVEDEKGGIEEALRKGFVLNWNATNCTVCRSSGGRCGFAPDPHTYAFRCYCPDRVHSVRCDPSPKQGRNVLIVATATSATMVVLLMLLGCCFRRKVTSAFIFLWKGENPTHEKIEIFLKRHEFHLTKRYTYSEIREMTNSFRNKLGQGGYGSVYEGKLPDGRLVAVKVLNKLKGNGEEFINEVASISQTSHVNIVSLFGFCSQGSKRALVYEFMPNGSLEKFIYEDNVAMGDRQLDCKTLQDIAIGTARGLEYLHRGCNTRILHFDIKPHNILLDVDFCPKISDFGLSKICPRNESIVSMLGARGTAGYIAPEVFSRNFGGVSHKSDVYSFGMMVLVMVGGRKNINVEVECSSEIYFPHWIYKCLEKNQQLALRCIKNENDNEIIRKMVLASLWCIQTDPSARPAMSKVVDMLEGSLESLQIPPKPFFSSPKSSPIHYSTSNL